MRKRGHLRELASDMCDGGKWDILIIGAGSAGCVLANQLSEHPTKRVLLIESGPELRNPLQAVPAAGYLLNMGRPQRDWMHRTCPDPSRGGRTDIWSRGKVVGGSSQINGMIYVRGDSSDFDQWAALGNAGWAWKDVAPLFRWIENAGGTEGYYGQQGLLSIQTLRRPHLLTRTFLEACGEIGIENRPAYNEDAHCGAALLAYTHQGRWRASAAKAFLDPIRKRPNLRTLPKRTVTRLIIKGKRTIGVEVLRPDGKTERYQANDIILSAGAIGSPQLLMASGIGDARDLRAAGIAPMHDLPGVGQNLQDHPCLPILAAMEGAIAIQSWPARVRAVLDWVFYGSGPLMQGHQAVAFVHSGAGLNRTDVQIHMAPLGALSHGEGEIGYAPRPSITLLPNVSRPYSRGYIKPVDSGGVKSVAIQPNMLGDDRDVATLARGAMLCERLLMSRAFAPYYRSAVQPFSLPLPFEAWQDFVRDNAATSYHHAGTCRMGSDPLAVVGPDLCVHGVEGLRVADGSIMPTIPSGNTNAACLMIGKKAADLIMSDLNRTQPLTI